MSGLVDFVEGGLVSSYPPTSLLRLCTNSGASITCAQKSLLTVTVVDGQFIEFDVNYVDAPVGPVRFKIFKGPSADGSVSVEVWGGDPWNLQTSFGVFPGGGATQATATGHAISATLHSDYLLTLTLDPGSVTVQFVEPMGLITEAAFAANEGAGGSTLRANVENVEDSAGVFVVGLTCDGGEMVAKSATIGPRDTESFEFALGSSPAYCWVTLYTLTARVFDEVLAWR